MANHKRRRPKHQRAGCLMCKPHKDERMPKAKQEKPAVKRKIQIGRDERNAATHGGKGKAR